MKIKNLSLFALLLSILLLGVKPQSADAVGNARFSIAGGNFNQNQAFEATIYLSSVDGVVAVQSDLIYDANQLQFVGIDATNSAFTGQAPSTSGNGTVSIQRYATPLTSVSGTVEVAKVSFMPIAGATTTTISFADSSVVLSSGGNIWDGVTVGAVFNFVAPQPPIPPPSISPLTPSVTAPSGSALRTPQTLDTALKSAILVPPAAPVNTAGPKAVWLIFIGFCSLAILALSARLFNLHKKFRGKSPKYFISRLVKGTNQDQAVN